jgi:hypothetical protein
VTIKSYCVQSRRAVCEISLRREEKTRELKYRKGDGYGGGD